MTCRIKANPPIRPSSIQWQYNAFIPISQTSNVSQETSKDNLLHYVRQDETKMSLGNNTTSYDSQSNNIITTSVNETLRFNQTRTTVVINTEPPTVWKFVEGITTKTGTAGFTIATHVSYYHHLNDFQVNKIVRPISCDVIRRKQILSCVGFLGTGCLGLEDTHQNGVATLSRKSRHAWRNALLIENIDHARFAQPDPE